MTAVIEVEGLTKSYGAVQAVRGVGLCVEHRDPRDIDLPRRLGPRGGPALPVR